MITVHPGLLINSIPDRTRVLRNIVGTPEMGLLWLSWEVQHCIFFRRSITVYILEGSTLGNEIYIPCSRLMVSVLSGEEIRFLLAKRLILSLLDDQ